MKNTLIGLFLLMAALFLPALSANADDDYYRGNSTWENSSPYFPIVEENFQDWNYTDAEGYGLKSEDVNTCATNARSDYENYSTFEVQRSVDSQQNKPDGKLTFFLDFCQIQPNCDTQSGTNYTLDPESTTGTGDYCGASWNNVSVGCINIYDNYSTVRPVTEGVAGDGSGSLTTSLIPLLERIQYTESSYGNKRGFTLEVGYLLEDNTVYWDTVRYMTGNLSTIRPDAVISELSDYTSSTCFYESNRGMVFEELFGSGVENVYLRFRPTSINRQIVRIHDLKIYGTAPDTGDATNPNSINQTKQDKALQIVGYDGMYKLTKTADVTVYDFSGRIVSKCSNCTEVNLTDSPKGVYFVRAETESGLSCKKIML